MPTDESSFGRVITTEDGKKSWTADNGPKGLSPNTGQFPLVKGDWDQIGSSFFSRQTIFQHPEHRNWVFRSRDFKLKDFLKMRDHVAELRALGARVVNYWPFVIGRYNDKDKSPVAVAASEFIVGYSVSDCLSHTFKDLLAPAERERLFDDFLAWVIAYGKYLINRIKQKQEYLSDIKPDQLLVDLKILRNTESAQSSVLLIDVDPRMASGATKKDHAQYVFQFEIMQPIEKAAQLIGRDLDTDSKWQQIVELNKELRAL